MDSNTPDIHTIAGMLQAVAERQVGHALEQVTDAIRIVGDAVDRIEQMSPAHSGAGL